MGAENGKAKKINFNPLTTETVELPENSGFVISHSCTSKEKAMTNDFNRRVVECRLASLLLQKYKYGKIDLDKIPTLKQVQEMYGANVENMVHQLDYAFARKDPDRQPNSLYTRKELCEALQISDEIF